MPSAPDTFDVCETRTGDLAQVQVRDPLRLMEPGGGIGWASAISVGVLIGTVMLTGIGLVFDAPATLKFLTLGGFDAR